MNFFERQQAVRAQSRRLILLFVLAVAGIVFVVDLSLLLLLGVFKVEQLGFWESLVAHRGALAVTSVLVLAIIGVASLGRMLQLRGGGAAVARELGGTQVPGDTRDPGYRRLRNVVEEVAIASALPVPDIFVLEQEAGINAFAAGWSASDAAIAVTRGAMDRLNRDELQGVVAHEFSHIMNGDMRLNIRLIGVLFGILALGLIGRQVLRHAHFSRSRGSAQVMVFGLALMVFGGIGLFIARVIKAGVSRQREYLADASAVQFTRQTQGLASALKKVGAVAEGSLLSNDQAEQVSHMLFGDGLGYSAWFSSHPPLFERIKALEPGFVAAQMTQLRKNWQLSPPDGLAEDRGMGLAEPAIGLPSADALIAERPAQMPTHIGSPDIGDYQHAAMVHADMPEALANAARSHQHVVAMLLALLHSPDAVLAARQLALVSARLGEDVAVAVSSQIAALRDLHPLLRLPLAQLAFPALRRRPRPELDVVLATVDALIHIDGQLDLFEYCLATLLHTQVMQALDPSQHWQAGKRKLVDCIVSLRDLLAVLAQQGHADVGSARLAFVAGWHCLLPNVQVQYPSTAVSVRALDAAWPELVRLAPAGKTVLIEAMAIAAAHDDRITLAEAELLRTVCALLQCPMPPLRFRDDTSSTVLD